MNYTGTVLQVICSPSV